MSTMYRFFPVKKLVIPLGLSFAFSLMGSIAYADDVEAVEKPKSSLKE